MRKQRRRSADQHICFRYTDSTIPLPSKSEISSLYPSSVTVRGPVVGNPEDRFSRDEAKFIEVLSMVIVFDLVYESSI